jgi:hypothetical protein
MPSMTCWTRLEPFTRLEDIEVGLQAQVHDPLWMLGRQWQSGEFQGEDAGTPVQARVRLARIPVTGYHPGPVQGDSLAAGVPYRQDVPLEALVEREPPAPVEDPRRDRRLAAEAGSMFLLQLDRAGVSAALRAAYATEPNFVLRPPPPGTVADPAGDDHLAVVAGRLPDGVLLHRALAASLRPAGGAVPGLPPRPAVPPAERAAVLQAAQAYLHWFEARHGTPSTGAASPAAWTPERMEYSFALSATVDDAVMALSAADYPGGDLDWYSFDVDVRRSVSPTTRPRFEILTRTVMPARVRYAGMAADRWWQFEDGQVNLGRVEGDADDLLRMLLIEFALLYSNDWYVLPVDASFGALYHLESLVVTDAFGERTLVPQVDETSAASPVWRMYSLSPTNDLLFLPPVVAAGLHGDPIEEVAFVRDEVANLVWAVEQRIPSTAGGSIDRRYPLSPGRVDDGGPALGDGAGDPLDYRVATTVAEQWIPFVPVRIDPQRPDVRLRRAAALLDQDGGSGLSRPHGRILEPDRPDLTVFEEEVPPGGLRVIRQYEYARWTGGQTVLWLARRKGPGRGDGNSGLRFDDLGGS